MDQFTLDLGPLPKKTRKEVFLDEMNQGRALGGTCGPHCPVCPWCAPSFRCRPTLPIETMLRIHCLPLWWNLDDSAVEEGLHEINDRPRKGLGVRSPLAVYRELLINNPQHPTLVH